MILANESNTIHIGGSVHANTFIAGISGTVIANGSPVIVDSNGHLGTTPSSERFKQEIKPMDNASESIFALKPITFRYRHELDREGIPQFGLLAEEVEKIDPDLVIRDVDGKVEGVRYEAINAMLLNEFLKEHHRSEAQEHKIRQRESKAEEQEARLAKQEATIAQQQKQIEALTAGLQKVTVHLESIQLAPRLVTGN